MELRRVLLLIAIVLGVAAIATSLSNPSDRDGTDEEPAPAAPAPAPATPAADGEGPVRVRFKPERRPRRAIVATGRPVTVTVAVEEPGEVELDGLGLTAPATPLTPARFELLPAERGRHRVRFTPAGEREASTIGVLQVESAE